MYDEILSSIDNIDECVMEAEMNVLNALCNEYDKAIMIMENYNGDSYDCFDIFQESVIMEDGESSGNNGTSQNQVWQSRKNSLLSRIIQSFKNMITKISMKIIGLKFDGVIKRIEKAPDGAKFILRGAMLKQPAEYVYKVIDAVVEAIVLWSDIITSNVNNTDGIGLDFNKDIHRDNIKKHKEVTNQIKPLLLETEELDGQSEVYLKENLLDIAKKEKSHFDNTCAKIRDMLKNMNKAFKNMKFSENSASNSVQLIKNEINYTIKEYLAVMKVLIKRINMYKEGTISDGNANTGDTKADLSEDSASVSLLQAKEIATWIKQNNPDSKYKAFAVNMASYGDHPNDKNSNDDNIIKLLMSKYNVKPGDKIVIMGLIDPSTHKLNKITGVRYDEMDDRTQKMFENGSFCVIK